MIKKRTFRLLCCGRMRILSFSYNIENITGIGRLWLYFRHNFKKYNFYISITFQFFKIIRQIVDFVDCLHGLCYTENRQCRSLGIDFLKGLHVMNYQKKLYCTIFFSILAVFMGFTAFAEPEYDDRSLLIEYEAPPVNLYSTGDKLPFFGMGTITPLNEPKAAARLGQVSLHGAGNEAQWYTLELNDSENADSALKKLQNMSSVKDVNYNYRMTTFVTEEAEPELRPAKASPTPPPAEAPSWGLSKCGIDGAREYLKENGFHPGGDHDIIVAVVDCGVDYAHQDLANNMWINEDEIPDNKIDDDNNGRVDDYHGYNFGLGSPMVDDLVVDDSHGTHCAGIIAAEKNEIGVCGVAYNVRIMPIGVARSGGSIFLNAVIRAINYAGENGADIVNLSLGISVKKGEHVNLSSLIGVIDDWCDKMLFVAAAGNVEDGYERLFDSQGNITQQSPGFPNESIDDVYKGNSVVTYPAALTTVIGVMSCDEVADAEGDYKSYFSRWDAYPGNGIEYEVMAPGNQIYSTKRRNRYGYMSGTSMAAPYVSGCCALLLTKYKDRDDFTMFQLRQLITQNVTMVQGLTENGKAYEMPMIDIEKALKAKTSGKLKIQDQTVTYTGQPQPVVTAYSVLPNPTTGKAVEYNDIVYEYKNIQSGMTTDQPTGVGTYEVTAAIDDLYYEGEVTATLRIGPRFGDFDKDGAVTQADIDTFMEYYRNYLTRRAYYAGADFNLDYKIDLEDLSYLLWYKENPEVLKSQK